MRSITTLAAAAALAAGCQPFDDHHDPEAEGGDRIHSVVLEGDELIGELAGSPSREAPVPFVRLGVAWDGPAPRSLEIATSVDGTSWSEWATPEIYGIELEETGSFVGELEVRGPEPARYYRIRGGELEPVFVGIEFLELSLSESLEDGEVLDEAELPVPAYKIGGVNVKPRRAWGARRAKCISRHTPRRITIHHTVTPTRDSMSPQARLRQIQRFHQNTRGWCDIGYQFLVSRDGRLWTGRGARRLGAHVANNNTGNVGISFMGTHTGTRATSRQIRRVARLVRGLARKFNFPINRTRVKGHRQFGGTTCPGTALYRQIPKIVSLARNGVSSRIAAVTPVRIRGVVYAGFDTSERVAGATVTLGERTAIADESGYFEFADVPEGEVTVSAAAAGYEAESVIRNATGDETWASVSLSAGGGRAALKGVVYRGTSSADRVPHATVTLDDGVQITADENGFFEVRNLAPGPVRIRAESGGDSGSVERTLIDGEIVWGSVAL